MRDKVKACISVHGLEPIPELPAASQMRAWFKEHSLVLAPSSHAIHDEVKRAGNKSKKYGQVVKLLPEEDEIRPLHMLKASMKQIRDYVDGVLPTEEYIVEAGEEQEEMPIPQPEELQAVQPQEDVQMGEVE